MSNSSATTTNCMFYKLMVHPILQHNKLRIPNKFVKKYGKELSSIVTLTGPNGRIWVVELEKVDRKLWFHNGWHEFLDYYSIRAGHFLVFKYGGESNFHVHVYDLTVCEISYPCNSSESLQRPCRDNQCLMAQVKQEAEADGFAEMFRSGDNVNKCFDKYMQSNRSSSGEYEQEGQKIPAEANFGYSRDKEVEFNESELTTTPCKVFLPISAEAGRMTRRRKQRTGSDVDELKRRTRQRFDKVSCPGIASETCTRRRRSVTQEEKERAISVADMYKPDNPFFKVVLRPSYVYRGFLLHIPNSFARNYLMSFSEFITLEVSEGKKWTVRCVTGNGRAKLCKGWTEFVWGNKLEEGDVCVFELANTNDVMKVTIFRVLEDEAESNVQENHLT